MGFLWGSGPRVEGGAAQLGPAPGGAAASVNSPKHTTDTITPAAKLSSRLVLRPESRRSTQAPQPPRPVPPIPAPAVINKVSHSPIRIPP